MTDIVERLLNPMWCHSETPFESPQLAKEEVVKDMAEAANEIERLRAVIDQLRSVVGAVSLDSGLTFQDIKGKARFEMQEDGSFKREIY